MENKNLIEIIEKRNLTTKVFQRENGQQVYQFHTRHIHFQDWDGDLKDVDTTIVPTTEGFEMTKAAFDFDAKATLEAGKSPYRFINELNPIGFLPRGLRWANKDVVFQDTAMVAGRAEKNHIEYAKAFGEAADLILEAMATGLRKVVRINQLPAGWVGQADLEVGFGIEVPPETEIWYQDPSTADMVNDVRRQLTELQKHRMVCEKAGLYAEARRTFRTQQQKEIELHDVMLVKWDQVADVRFRGEYQIRRGGVRTYGRVPMVWDSAGKSQAIQVELRMRNGKPYFVKLIPIEFLQAATFPVFTDTTTSYYAGAGDGRVQLTGSSGQSFSTVRNAASGNNTTYTATNETFVYNAYLSGGNQYRISRGFFPSDTSAIDDGATILSATLKIYSTASGASDIDGVSAHIVPSSQASNTQLVNDDYNNISFTDCGSKTLASITASTYQSISLNATGLSNISKTGFSLFAVIGSIDLNNSSSPTNNGNTWQGYFSEQSGTSNDPYLEVVSGTTHTKSISDEVVLVDAVTKQGQKRLTEVVTLVDTLIRGSMKSLTEVVTLVDTVESHSIFTLVLSDAISLEDTVDSKITAKILTEEILLTDTISDVMNFVRGLTETIILVDAVTYIQQRFKTISDAITLVDTVSPSSTYGRVLTEVVVLTDRIYGLLNGVNMKWRKKYTEKVSAWRKKYLNF